MTTRVIRNALHQGLFDVPPGTVGRVVKDDGRDKLSVRWSDGSWGLYRREALEFGEA